MTVKSKSKTVLAALLLPVACLAQDWRDGDAAFNAKSNFITKTTVIWVVVEDVQRSCERESHKRGFGGFGYGVAACSFWTKSQCTIVTSSKPTMHQLGHELRHCFQGSFH